MFVSGPLAWPVTEVLVTPIMGEIGEDAGRRIDDEAGATLLRALRAEARAMSPPASDILVNDGDTTWYRVFVRDELPRGFMTRSKRSARTLGPERSA